LILPKGTNEKAAVLSVAGSRIQAGVKSMQLVSLLIEVRGFYPRFYGIEYNALD